MGKAGEYITSGQLAEETDTPRRTISYWAKQGLIPAVRYSRGLRIYYMYPVQEMQKIKKNVSDLKSNSFNPTKHIVNSGKPFDPEGFWLQELEKCDDLPIRLALLVEFRRDSQGWLKIFCMSESDREWLDACEQQMKKWASDGRPPSDELVQSYLALRWDIPYEELVEDMGLPPRKVRSAAKLLERSGFPIKHRAKNKRKALAAGGWEYEPEKLYELWHNLWDKIINDDKALEMLVAPRPEPDQDRLAAEATEMAKKIRRDRAR